MATFNSYDYKKITKPTARKAYESGKTIMFFWSNLRFGNMWVQPFTHNKRSGDTFDSICNSADYYKAKEYGRLTFYIKK
jgi:hypothetical protein